MAFVIAMSRDEVIEEAEKDISTLNKDSLHLWRSTLPTLCKAPGKDLNRGEGVFQIASFGSGCQYKEPLGNVAIIQQQIGMQNNLESPISVSSNKVNMSKGLT